MIFKSVFSSGPEVFESCSDLYTKSSEVRQSSVKRSAPPAFGWRWRGGGKTRETFQYQKTNLFASKK